MNKERRKRLSDVISKLQKLQEEINGILEDEENYRDNIPENMQESERYENADAGCDNLQSASDSMEEIISYLEDARN